MPFPTDNPFSVVSANVSQLSFAVGSNASARWQYNEQNKQLMSTTIAFCRLGNKMFFSRKLQFVNIFLLYPVEKEIVRGFSACATCKCVKIHA